MHIFSIPRVVLMALCALLSAQAWANTPEEIRATLFREASDALTQANAVKASVYAPISYSEGAKAYRKAESNLAAAGSLDDIQEALEDAARLFQNAVAAASVAQATLPAVIAAREDCERTEAARYAAQAWQTAEATFANAVRRLENDSVKSAQRLGEQARAQYRAAELLAIQANYLDETRALLVQARDARAKRYAPATLAKAEQLLSAAEQALETDRYDTDQPRALAQQAKYEARHAIYLADVGAKLRGNKITFEAQQLAWENAVRGVADQLDSPIDFASGPEHASNLLVELIAERQNEMASTRSQVLDQSQQIAALNAQITSLEDKLGGDENPYSPLTPCWPHRNAFVPGFSKRNIFSKTMKRSSCAKATTSSSAWSA